MRWLKSRKKTAAAVLGLGGLLVTGLGLADSAQAASSHTLMVRKDGTMTNIRSVMFGRATGDRSACFRVQTDLYTNTGFQVYEGERLGVIPYADENCQQEAWDFGVDVPDNIPTSNWWYTMTAPS
jgi:hypothetical protein